MRPLFRIVLLVVVSFTSLLWAPAHAIENDTFGIEPYPEQSDGAERGTFSIPLEPGAVFEDAVRIYNRTDQPLDLLVYAADAEAAPDDTEISPGFRASRPKGVGSWIDLARETVELEARDEVIITFRVEVKTSEPSPQLGAIVVENTARGLSGDAAQREFLPVRTVSPNSETASVRVRPLLLRSPWIVVAMLGVVVAIALVWIGARRARRPKDVLVPAGEIAQPELEPEDVQEASRPVIKRLGASEASAPEAGVQVLTRAARADDRPLLEDAFLVEVEPEEDDDSVTGEVDTYEALFEDEDDDEEDEDLPPARSRPTRAGTTPSRTSPKKKPAAKKPAEKKPAPRREAVAAKNKQPKPKPAPKKKPARPAAKKRAPARKASRKPPPPKTSGYIPLDEL
jgi:hypothetical protein